MTPGNGKVAWEIIFKISQVAVLPLLAAMFYIMMQISGFDKRLAILETLASRPVIDVALSNKLAVMEDRQDRVLRVLDRNTNSMVEIKDDIRQHDLKSKE